MLKKRILKITFVLACIITMIMPYTSTVLAAITHEDTTAELQVLRTHEGKDETSGILTDEQKEYYDISPYGYTVGETKIYKIIEKGDYNYQSTFYCLNALKSFPGVTSAGLNSLEYTNVAELDDATNSNIKGLYLSTNYADNQEKWTENYRALNWLINNMYLKKPNKNYKEQGEYLKEQKNTYLSKAFADYEGSDLEVVEAFLTDDDIDVVQQYAIWYFTNGDNNKYNTNTLPAVELMKINMDQTVEYGSYNDITGQAERQQMANHLFKYLVENAKKAEDTAVTYPQLAEVTTGANLLDDSDYYVVGPYKVTSGTAAKTQYSIKLLDQEDKEISRDDYKIYIEGEEDFTNKNVDEIFDTQYYIYLPKSNKTVTKVRLQLNYTTYETKATLWKNNTKTEDGEDLYQPVMLVTREPLPYSPNKDYEIDRSTADLALRKYIVKVNDKELDRAPTVDVTKLKNGTSLTAEYKHAKAPVKVSNGDTIVYEIRVYNEADIDARGTTIIDALPKGLELVKESTINTTYGWEIVTEGNNVVTYKTEYLRNEVIGAFDKNSSLLNSAIVQIECKVSDAAKASSVLTNIAEIQADEIEDRDSIPENNDYVKNDYDSSGYTGHNDNKEDLTDENEYYKGREDDDDFEKVEVEGKTFDLSLKKFVTKINKNAPATSREPEVDVTNLKNGTSKTATYRTVKTPLVVEEGDIVTYTIRVYNEGETAGYAEEVADYIPEGLGYLDGHTTNVDNYWLLPEEIDSDKTIKLSDIENGKKNLSVDDFNGKKNLDEVEVVKGKIKITSTKLASSDSNTKNLIDGFDRENDTTLDYRDIQVVCIVLDDEVVNNNFRNIAEITKDSDKNREEVTDQDSIPDSTNPDNYPGDDADQDDNDYENLATDNREFDLKLQKFITGLNNNKVTGRETQVLISSDGKIQYSAPSAAKDPLKVAKGDTVIYTIRVYNEGNIAGYAEEISDNLPRGLEFLKDHETNKKYGWKLYDKNGNETTDLSQAVKVKTDYLSRANGTNNIIDEYDKGIDKSLDYKDVQIAFKVLENTASSENDRILRNIAEITDDADKDGNSVDDIDSTPDNNKDGEDDIDDEKVYVQYFDLSLQKDLVKIIVTEDGTTREIPVAANAGLQKVEIHRKKINTTNVKFVYNITVKNEGEIAGYATEITDYIPEGLEFIQEENTAWTKVSDREITTNALSNTKLEPGQTASVQVVLKWINNEENFGEKVNVAEISADKNDSNTEDIDSTPDNKKDGEDDIDDAKVILSISTGTAPTYIILTLIVSMIMVTGIVLIKKYVLI